jgi:hypothetical protein
VGNAEKLFIIADGPRFGHPTDTERCAEVRAIVEQVDWPCDVYQNFSDDNLGCKRRVNSGLDWVFSQVERAIVLEDDCVPHPDFFSFCDTLLDRYADDDRVWVITGDNFQNGQRRGNGSYYFSKYNHVWGWATWRRAWQRNDGSLSFWPAWQSSADWRAKMPDAVERRYWEATFNRAHAELIDTWDYAWSASVWYHGGLIATPNVNLVSNIGFGADGTHTTASTSNLAEVPTHPLGELTHLLQVVQDVAADKYVFNHHFGGRNLRFPRSLLGLPRRVGGTLYRQLKRSFTG